MPQLLVLEDVVGARTVVPVDLGRLPALDVVREQDVSTENEIRRGHCARTARDNSPHGLHSCGGGKLRRTQLIEGFMNEPREHEPENRSVLRWKLLSLATAQSRRAARPISVNAALIQAGDDKGLEALHPAFSGWIAENHFHAADFNATIAACRDLISRFPSSEWSARAELLIAQSHLRLGDSDNALRALDAAATSSFPDAHNARLAHAELLEWSARKEEAAASYRELILRKPAESESSWLRRLEGVAEQAIKRCQHPTPQPCSTTPRDVAFKLSKILRERDFEGLRALASPTHFGWGLTELVYEGFDAVADDLERDLACSDVLSDPTQLTGGGASYSLVSMGWRGKLFVGRVLFQISEQPGGWQLTGVSFAGAPLMRKGGWPIGGYGGGPPTGYLTPDFSMKAPWPVGTCLRAGGWMRFWESLIPLYGIFIIAADMSSGCGYGIYGYYYNTGPTHVGQDSFAIDFTGYYRGFPFLPDVQVTPALASHDGVVTTAIDPYTNGTINGTGGNTVALDHLTTAELATFLKNGELPKGTTATAIGGAFRTLYLHLAQGLYVSRNMYIPQGTPLGMMDNTGNCAMPHVHFVLHARDYVVGGRPYYSVPLQNFEGQNLGQDDDGECICSSNEGPPPMPPIS